MDRSDIASAFIKGCLMRSVRDLSMIALLAVVSLTTAFFAIPRAGGHAPPPLVAEPATIDLGDLNQGDVRNVTFHLKNQGKSPVQILDVLSGCDCTRAEVPKIVLQPGQGLDVPVTWQIGTRRHDVMSSVTVLASDVAKAAGAIPCRFDLTARVLPDVEYAPERLEFEPGVASEREVAFTPGRLAEIELGEAFCTQRAFSAELSPETNVVRVRFNPEAWSPDLREAVLVVGTNSPAEPQCKIPITVQEGPPLERALVSSASSDSEQE